MALIDGKKVADEIRSEIKAVTSVLPGRPPCLAVMMLGEHGPSQIYVKRKMQACEEVGIASIRKNLSEATTEAELLTIINELNVDPNIDGLLVQLPLPPHINVGKIMQAISPEKDVDGFHPVNVGKLLSGEKDGFIPCTPLAVQTLLERYNIDVAGKHVIVFGRSNIVGKPMAAMLMQSMTGGNATVTVLHSRSQNIKEMCALGDILIVAVGKPHLITEDMVKEGCVIVDVGINKVPDDTSKNGYKIVGDVDYDGVKDKCAYISPVPGGVGPMTIAMLLKNTLKSYLMKFPVK